MTQDGVSINRSNDKHIATFISAILSNIHRGLCLRAEPFVTRQLVLYQRLGEVAWIHYFEDKHDIFARNFDSVVGLLVGDVH